MSNKTTSTITVTELTAHTRPVDLRTIVEQIGRMNLLAISGGRVGPIESNGEVVGAMLPVGSGYSVAIVLDGADVWRVYRLFKRGGKLFNKGCELMVYAPDLAESAYVASCYVNRDFGGE